MQKLADLQFNHRFPLSTAAISNKIKFGTSGP